MAWISRHRTLLATMAMVAIVCLGLVALHHLTETVSLHEAKEAFRAIPPASIALALALTATSYFALTFYDVLALRSIGRPLPWRIAALASFTSYTLSHNLGFSALTGGSARYRVYHAAGLEAPDVARIVIITGITFWQGVLVIGSVALLTSGPLDISGVTLSQDTARILGIVTLVLALSLPLASLLGVRSIGFRQWSIPVVRPHDTLAQLGVAAIDLTTACAALIILVPGASVAMLPTFILAYAMGLMLGLVTHVPGGIGVFEATILAIVPGDKATLLASLVAYRAIYYLLPLAIAVVVFAVREGSLSRKSTTPVIFSRARAVANGVAPLLLSTLAFLGGVILLLSGSLPAAPHRLFELRGIVPLPFVEASHIAASLAGTALLVLAPGLFRRLDGAWHAVRALLIAGAVFSLAKGLDYEEAILLTCIAALLQWTRPAFYRHTALTALPLSATWIGSIAIAFGLSIWLGFFAYRHVEYQDALWWEFAWSGNASRFLRAMFAAAVLLVAFGIWRLLAPAPAPRKVDALDPDILARALQATDRTDAMLALTGDKRFIVSDAHDAFLMYQVKGSSWIVMGDPVGPRERWPELLWGVRDLADAAQGRLLLYQISGSALPLAIELGLKIVKYGEEALVPLDSFSLEGHRARGLRQAVRRLAREGATFEMIPASEVPSLMPQLQAISDQWLASKGHKEKCFSLGRFDPGYMAQFDCAVVRYEGRIVAFANIWATPDKSELSLDLMRHSDDAPSGTMDFLFAQLMLWGQSEGYGRFSLGAAPLSGIDPRRLSPLWAKAAAMVYKHGERFYGFRGLRSYKSKFVPAWEPRFIAGPGGLSLVQGMLDIGALIGSPPAPPARRKADEPAITLVPEPLGAWAPQ